MGNKIHMKMVRWKSICQAINYMPVNINTSYLGTLKQAHLIDLKNEGDRNFRTVLLAQSKLKPQL